MRNSPLPAWLPVRVTGTRAPVHRSRKPNPPPDLVVRCPYCTARAQLVTGAELFPLRPDLRGRHYYSCAPCDAHVGCHPGTTTPLGSLADAELRRGRQAAHAAFDPLWRGQFVSRNMAYTWLADRLGVAHDKCHIGMFDLATCKRVVALCASAGDPARRQQVGSAPVASARALPELLA